MTSPFTGFHLPPFSSGCWKFASILCQAESEPFALRAPSEKIMKMMKKLMLLREGEKQWGSKRDNIAKEWGYKSVKRLLKRWKCLNRPFLYTPLNKIDLHWQPISSVISQGNTLFPWGTHLIHFTEVQKTSILSPLQPRFSQTSLQLYNYFSFITSLLKNLYSRALL